MKWWLIVIGLGTVCALAVVIGAPFFVWLAYTWVDTAGVASAAASAKPSHGFDHGTFSIAILQSMLTMTIIIIAVTGFMGYQAIKNAAVEKAGSVATEKADEELKRWVANQSSIQRPSPPAHPPTGDDPAAPPAVPLEMESEGDAPN